MTPMAALALSEVPATLAVIGAGHIGLEIATIYAALGSRVTLFEQAERLLPKVDADLVTPLADRFRANLAAIHLNTRFLQAQPKADALFLDVVAGEGPATYGVDRAVLAVGRIPNDDDLGLHHTGITLDERGFIRTDEQQRTETPHIFAVGDVTGGTLLAHKAERQGRIAAEVIAGKKSAFTCQAIPAVIYTDPQIAWCGLTEEEARQNAIPYAAQHYFWRQAIRARMLDTSDGLTKLLIEPKTGRILGAGITGRHAETLIGEAALAIEMGALAEDLALTLHPQPTLAETTEGAAAMFSGKAVKTATGL